MNRNDPTRLANGPKAPASDLERVEESLSFLAAVIEKMREAVGKTGPPPNVVRMEFAAAHDRMMTSFLVAVKDFVKPLVMDVPTLSYSRGKAVLECWWKERREQE